MNKTKSLLLGTAAALFAVTGAEAADMPVEVVEYVRICDAYGTGFFFIPGTDVCLRISGFARFELKYNSTTGVGAGNNGRGYDFDGDPYLIAFDENQDDKISFEATGRLRFDARSQTEWGTLRTFLELQAGTENSSSWNARHAYVQWGGLTAGLTDSFFSSIGSDNFGTVAGQVFDRRPLIAYTQPFGNGFSVSISLEDPGYADGAILQDTAFDAPPSGVEGRTEVPELVGRLQVDQAWGTAKLMGAVHGIEVFDDDTVVNQSDQEVGFAIGASLALNLPFIAEGDQFIIEGAWGIGAGDYTYSFVDAFWNDVPGDGDEIGDQVMSGNVSGSFLHYWTPSLRSNIMAGYVWADLEEGIESQIEEGSCGGNLSTCLFGASASNAGQLKHAYSVGGNLIWSPAPRLDIGLEIVYAHIDTSQGAVWDGNDFEHFDEDSDAWGGIFRIQRNF